MLFMILTGLFVILCFVLIFLILIQKGKSSLGLGSLGGGTQMLFGGSGGQDLFQKTTWILGAIFMGGSLGLALMKKPARSTLLGKLEQKQEIHNNSAMNTKAQETKIEDIKSENTKDIIQESSSEQKNRIENKESEKLNS